MGDKILSVLLEITPNLAMRATGTPLSSPKGTMWCVFDLTPSGKECACVYFNFLFTIKLTIGLNVFQQDPSPHGRILLLVSLFNSFHQEGLQNSKMTSLCSNNIKASHSLKHGLVSRTYSKKPFIMTSIFSSKSKSYMTMSIPSQEEPLIKWQASSDTEFVCTKRDDSDVMFIEIIKKNDDYREEEPKVDENAEAREL
nr:hypothetical protein [Tanacetum cinerariifolium]